MTEMIALSNLVADSIVSLLLPSVYVAIGPYPVVYVSGQSLIHRDRRDYVIIVTTLRRM